MIAIFNSRSSILLCCHSAFASCYTYRTLTAEHIRIFTAVQMETRAVQHALRGSACSLHTIGVGAGHLPSPDQLAGVRVIILCGVAGALDPYFRVGDVILDDPAKLISPDIHIHRGTIFTSKQIVATPAEKTKLFIETKAAAVDMEQSIVREFADRIGIPLIGLRAISDTAAQTLDPVVVHLVDDRGRPRPLNIAIHLIRRPSLIPYLRQLNANTRLALDNLGPALQNVVDGLL